MRRKGSSLTPLGTLTLSAFAIATGLVQDACFGSCECDYGDRKCSADSRSVSVCSGGEGYCYWSDELCPGVDPVCSSVGAGDATCADRATLDACPTSVTEVAPVASGSRASVVDTGDLDGDGQLDLLLLNDGLLRLSSGDGRGGFAPVVSIDITVAGTIRDAIFADVDGDGRVDIVVSASDPSELYVFMHREGGAFELGARYFVSARSLDDAADLDGDGIDEVAATAGDEGVHLLSQLGQTELVDVLVDTTQSDYYGPSARDATIVDLDGQAPPDLAVGVLSSVDLFVADSAGGFTRTASIGANAGWTIADLDGNGRADLLVGDRDSSGQELLRVSFIGGRGEVERDVETPLPYETIFLAVGDFDGDGVSDVAAGHHPSMVSLLAVRDGALERQATYTIPVSTSVVIAVDDLDSDGRDDILLETDTSLWVIAAGCMPP